MTVVVRAERQIVVAPVGVTGTQGPPGPAGSGSTIGVKDEGTLASAVVERINFTGAGVSVSGSGADVSVTIPGGGSVVNVRDYGASPSASAATNNAAFQAALDYLESSATTGSFNGYAFEQGVGGGKLFIPRGLYNLSAALDIKSTVIIEGEGGHDANAASTVLQWAGSSSGFRIQRKNTSGDATYNAVSHNGGDGSIIRNLWLAGGYTSTEGEYHAIHAKARFRVENVICSDWPGDAFHVVAFAGSGGALEGNANCWRIDNGVAVRCRSGLFLWGDNTNAGTSLGFNATSCRQWGIIDRSFLTNQHIGFHLDSNGQNPLSMATISGKVYYCIVGQETWCSTNAPSGTTADNQGWGYHDVGGVGNYGARAWVSGLTWRAGGAICTDNSNAFHVVSGYVEGGQAPSMLNAHTIVISGGMYGPLKSYGTTIDHGSVIGADGGNGGIVVGGTGRFGGGVKMGGRLEITGGSFGGQSGPIIYKTASDGLVIIGSGGSSNEILFADHSGSQIFRVPAGTFDLWGYGNLHCHPPASVTPTENGQMSFELTSDTQLKIKVKGSDGVVRSGSITLS